MGRNRNNGRRGGRIYTDEDLERIAYENAYGKGSWSTRNSATAAAGRCEACDGTTECGQCNGTGYKDNSNIPGAYSSSCDTCNRTGTCHVCKGTGKQPETR
jgi:DnaJ-class molecular chaperone